MILIIIFLKHLDSIVFLNKFVDSFNMQIFQNGGGRANLSSRVKIGRPTNFELEGGEHFKADCDDLYIILKLRC